MSSTSVPAPRLRVALAAAPPLLAESLRTLLPADAEITVVLTEVSAGPFDVAVVAGGVATVEAEVVVTLDDRMEAGGGGTVSFA